MDKRWFALLPGLAVLAAACSAGGSSGGSADSALDPDTEPIVVQVAGDPSLAVSRTIGPEGGAITASGRDGTTFTLTVPAQALLQPTEITMTPLTSVEGVPFGEGPMAVQLEPSGLTFFDFVTLTIQPATDLPIDQQIPIAATGEGYLEMPFADISDGVLRLQLQHFSSAGATKGVLADTAPWRARLGGDVEARLSSVAARELLHYRQSDEDSPVPESFWRWLREAWWEHVMKPRLDAADQSCAAGRLAIETALSFERQAQLMGWADEGHSIMQQVMEILPTVARRCIQEEYELCRDEHIIHRMIPVLLSLQRQIQLARLAGSGMDDVMAEGMELTRSCLHFELRLMSQAQGDISGPTGTGTFTSDMEANLPIELVGSVASLDLEFQGSAEMNNLDFTFHASTEGFCTSDEVPGGATFSLVSLSWDAAPPDETHPYGSVRDIELNYSPGWSGEMLILRCPGVPPHSVNIAAWSTAHLAVHMGEISSGGTPGGAPAMPDLSSLLGAGGGVPGMPAMPGGAGDSSSSSGPTFRAVGWQVRGGELYAVREWDLSTAVDTSALSEFGTFELYHKPR